MPRGLDMRMLTELRAPALPPIREERYEALARFSRESAESATSALSTSWRQRVLCEPVCWCAGLLVFAAGAMAGATAMLVLRDGAAAVHTEQRAPSLPDARREKSVPGSHSSLRRWVQLLTAPTDATLCPYQFPRLPNGSAVGSWQLCCAAMPVRPAARALPPCVAVSVGVGGEWLFEDAVATHARCAVHVSSQGPEP